MEIKNKFWGQLDDVTEHSAGRLLVHGDQNGRIGRKDETKVRRIGVHEENVRNKNDPIVQLKKQKCRNYLSKKTNENHQKL